MSKPWKKFYRAGKKGWDILRESTVGQALASRYGLGDLFRKETSPGSGVYETQPLINPASIAFAGAAGLLVYIIVKKKK